ncbi:UDP-2,4-diacetamido-2,4,6-trideoxy-beta-L-altropyranose hydrolase [Brevundimonas sp. FT23042]|uniref:UDP-2,4-diacetamido-2,4, 6-trideoxy-beta-L-altropyranose hydrolase n=1 Tax=Brevundimonas sp. FT23042 TaxID=3393749 RepID=UPI003B586880
MTVRVGIRADASVNIGTGHIRRCAEIARELVNRGAEVTFLCRDLGLDCRKLIAEVSASLIVLPPPSEPFAVQRYLPVHAPWAEVSWQTDAEQSEAALGQLKPDLVVIDHYAFDYRWHGRLRSALGCAVVALDDLGDRPLDVELIIDHNYCADHAAKHEISDRFGPRILGGPSFALLSAAYGDLPQFHVAETLESVGIFMGGSDAANHSEWALDAVRLGLPRGISIELVTTSANPHLDRIKEILARDPKCTLTIDLPNLATFFQRHDLQIGAGGGATWERCCAGAPTVAIGFADNHRPVLAPLDELGVLTFVREGDTDIHSLAAAVGALAADVDKRRQMSIHARRLVDGRGIARVGDEIYALAA